jgi:hypothetical protein
MLGGLVFQRAAAAFDRFPAERARIEGHDVDARVSDEKFYVIYCGYGVQITRLHFSMSPLMTAHVLSSL